MFAIKNLTTLRSFDSNDGPLSPEPEPEQTASNENVNGNGDDNRNVANKLEKGIEDIPMLISVAETELSSGMAKPPSEDDDKDDDSTAAISESSSSSHVFATVVTPTEAPSIAVVPPLQSSEHPVDTTSANTGLQETHTGREKTESTPVEVSTAAFRESETSSLTLAQRMKEMFDSSPDQPSNAFGKNNIRPSVSVLPISEDKGDGKADPPKSAAVSLAKDMKDMFDSPSPDGPSRAFGKQPSIQYDIDTDTLRTKTPNSKAMKPSSPVSVADQMVSMLWASSAPTKKSPARSIDPETDGSVKQEGVVDKISRAANPVVILDTAIEDEIKNEIEIEDEDADADIEEITVGEEGDGVAMDIDDAFDELIEEVTIEDDCSRDAISIATDDGFFEHAARIEMSPEFVNTAETRECDGQSFDEVTAEEWEYDEKTVDEEEEEEENVVREDLEDGIDSSNEQFGNSDTGTKANVNAKTIVAIKNIGHGLADPSCNELPESLDPQRSDTRKKLIVETKISDSDNNNLEQNHLEKFPTISPIARCAPAIKTQTKLQEMVHRTDSPKVQKLNPRLVGDSSATGTLAEKLKMFGFPKQMSAPKTAIAIQQSCRTPKSPIKPSRDELREETKLAKGGTPKTPVVLPVVQPRAKQVYQLDTCTQPSNVSAYIEEDRALVETIVSLVKEPGAMQHKHVLAQRITSLLTGEKKEKAKVVPTPTPNRASPLAPWMLAERPSPKSHHEVEAKAYSNRKNDGFRDPGLEQMRKNGKLQKAKLHHVDDPDTIPKRQMRRINLKDRKEEAAKQGSLPPASNKTQKVVDAEDIIARIWPKTPDGGERKPKAFSSSSSRSGKCTAFESPRATPNKLGDKLKMFESSPSPSTSPLKHPGTFEKASLLESTTTSGKETKYTKVAVEHGIVSDNAGSHQISKKTVTRLLSFQRLWRRKKSKRNTTTTTTHRVGETQTDVALPLKKKVPNSKRKVVAPLSPHAKVNGEINTNRGLSNQSFANYSDPASVRIPTSASAPVPQAPREPPTTRSSRGSYVGCHYSLEDLEQGRFDPSVVDMDRWEGFLSDESFYQHFGLTKDDFYQQPEWKRKKQKRKVRVAF